MAALARAIRRGARFVRFGIPPGWRSRRRWCRGADLIDAPPDGLTVEQVAPLARDYELAVLHTSTPSFANDARFAARLKEENPRIRNRHGRRSRRRSAPAIAERRAGSGLGCARRIRLHLRGDRRGQAAP